MSIYYDLIVDEKSRKNGKWEKWNVMDHQSVTNLQNLVHGFWEDSKALVSEARVSPQTGWGKGSMKRIVSCK